MEDWRFACRCLQKSRVEASLFLSLFVRLPQCYWSRQRLQPAGRGQGCPQICQPEEEGSRKLTR